jgi:hypothetical protein
MNDMWSHDDEQLRELLNDAVSDVEPRESLDELRSRASASSRSRTPWIWGAGATVLVTAATVAAVAAMGGGLGTTSADTGFATVAPTGSTSGSGVVPSPSQAATGQAEEPTTPQPGGKHSRLPGTMTTLPSLQPTWDPTAQASGETTGGATGGATGSATGQSGQPGQPTDPGQGSTSAPGTGGSNPMPRAVTLPVYYVGATGHGPRLFREFHRALTSSAPTTAVQDAVDAQPDDPDYRVPWPAGTSVGDVRPDAAGITVDLLSPAGASLRNRPAGMSDAEARVALQQVVYTAQAASQSTAPVQLLLDGRQTDTILGVPAAAPISRAPASDVLALVWVIDPSEGARVHSDVQVHGLANTFEANVQWELMQDGSVVQQGSTTAARAFTMAPYSFTISGVAPGQYTLVVHDEDASGGASGIEPWQDTKNITVVR